MKKIFEEKYFPEKNDVVEFWFSQTFGRSESCSSAPCCGSCMRRSATFHWPRLPVCKRYAFAKKSMNYEWFLSAVIGKYFLLKDNPVDLIRPFKAGLSDRIDKKLGSSKTVIVGRKISSLSWIDNHRLFGFFRKFHIRIHNGKFHPLPIRCHVNQLDFRGSSASYSTHNLFGWWDDISPVYKIRTGHVAPYR